MESLGPKMFRTLGIRLKVERPDRGELLRPTTKLLYWRVLIQRVHNHTVHTEVLAKSLHHQLTLICMRILVKDVTPLPRLEFP